MLNEFYRIAFRKKIDPDDRPASGASPCMGAGVQFQRPHQGRWCYGKTPMQTFFDSLELAKEKLFAA